MKILIVADVPDWALGSLSQSIQKYNRETDIRIIYCHPKDVRARVPKVIEEFQKNVEWADIVHFQYWSLCHEFHEIAKDVLDKKRVVLTHHNQKNLLSHDWSWVDMLVCHTEKAKKILTDKYGRDKVKMIRHGIDLNEFKFNEKYGRQIEKTVGFVGRIVRWKGFLEVVRASKELGYRVLFMGRIDDNEYYSEMTEEERMSVDWSFMKCEDAERAKAYHEMTVYVGNSGDNHEEGTLGYLEAMASGVPVITTPSGVAADIAKNGENAVVVPFGENGSPCSVEVLKVEISRVMEDSELRERLRQEGWLTVKNMPIQRMAWEYLYLYYYVHFHGTFDLVSVIIPSTKNRLDLVRKIIDRLEDQTYEKIESIIVWDHSDGVDVKFDSWIPIRQFHIKKESGYNLAEARNIGALEAMGEILMFNDSRIFPSIDAVAGFCQAVLTDDERKWYFGNKGSGKKTFVENFSAIRRKYFLSMGGCNMMVDRYGGMSQELRVRFTFGGFGFEYCGDIMAEGMVSSKWSGERRSDVVESKFKLLKMNL